MKCTYYKVMQYRIMDGKRMYARCAGTVDGYPTSRNPNAGYNDWGCLRGIDISLRRIADALEEKKGSEQ